MMKQIDTNTLCTLAGAYAGYKRNSNPAKTGAIAEFVRNQPKTDRLAFSIVAAGKLGRGKAEEAARKELSKHISRVKAHLEETDKKEKRDILISAAERSSLPFYENTHAVLTIVDPKAATMKEGFGVPKSSKEEVALTLVSLASSELSSKSTSYIWELKRLEKRLESFYKHGILKKKSNPLDIRLKLMDLLLRSNQQTKSQVKKLVEKYGISEDTVKQASMDAYNILMGDEKYSEAKLLALKILGSGELYLKARGREELLCMSEHMGFANIKEMNKQLVINITEKNAAKK